MELSEFGRKFTGRLGINELMDDLGRALAEDRSIAMLGGGNPAHIPTVQKAFHRRMSAILEQPGEFERLVGNYDTPQGKSRFLEALACLLRDQFGWEITSSNIALTNGSQNSFFFLFNMLAGRFGGGRRKRILFPLTPEYIGYADLGLDDDFFTASRPSIERLDDDLFKYRLDLDALRIDETVGAVCVSRPTNPTGNVVTDEELAALAALTRERGVPLIIDNAYGTPFPNIVFAEAGPLHDDNTIVCMSLSKLGLPALRTGIVIAKPEIIRAISGMTAVLSLAPGGMGAALALDMVESGEIIRLSRDVIRPYYHRKAMRAVDQLRRELRGTRFALHKPEGAIFLWLWFEGLPITDQELYERLKRRGVLVVPGHYFFPGMPPGWRHMRECIRVTYAQEDAVVERGISVIAEEVKKARGD
jgi:valine--pyruvate aminotransferase